MPIKTKEISPLTEENIARFWSHVDKSASGGCWIWTGAKYPRGYGAFRIEGRNYRTHRLSYFIQKGQIQENLLILHHCDNPSCVNPDHLWMGTQEDNMIDCSNKRRTLAQSSPHKLGRGSRNGASKLTEKQVLEIRAKYIPQKYTQCRLAKEYGITQTGVSRIIKRINWKHMPEVSDGQ